MPWVQRNDVVCDPGVNTPLINVTRPNLRMVAAKLNTPANRTEYWGVLRYLVQLDGSLSTVVVEAETRTCWYRNTFFGLSNNLSAGQVVIYVPRDFGTSPTIRVYELVP